ncbi:hypothetical protein ASPZODRAFT_1454013 [Penicilliopsis zonata CBS 506.65]|uniref:Uncharacterized protein n=1 Tax=Penicilliopsis zonata CBS 506.65 TaxID=1073090 RepID=A0A1L9SQ38_9EURO|nr:hypothetical protein ASPZODRAFT_1454013 [Penicilliopsis zonata CBS 506.65]OJJ49330.1 hypothetical protein ASPZODRAFT_1454013 [Penicilliopsis zonata CBS 506.65]
MEPIFSAVSSNVHHLYTLLQCIGFSHRATVQITPDGIRFSVEEARVIQGLAFLDKALFSNYTFNPPNKEDDTSQQLPGESDDSPESELYPCFVISLSALLETLKIFSINDSSAVNSSRSAPMQTSNHSSSNAFTAPSLLLDHSCTLQYLQTGSSLSVTLNEAGVKTTCDLTTYEPEEGEIDIPLQRNAIIMKIIMRSAWLHNAITELDATNPTALKISASATHKPFFALSGTGGPFSESTVEFSVDQQHKQSASSTAETHHKVLAEDGSSRARAKRSKLAPTVTETFLVSPPSSRGPRIIEHYRFALIRKAMRAMAVANKVSIRGDRQGVLSLQFMIELDGSSAGGASIRSRPPAGQPLGDNVSFVDFRFVPLIEGEAEEGLEEDTGR